MKNLILSMLVMTQLVVPSAISDEVSCGGASSCLSLLREKHLVVTYTLSSKVDPSLYVSLMRDLNENFSKESLERMWLSFSEKNRANEFLIVKSFSSEVKVGSSIVLSDNNFVSGFMVGEQYLLFLNDDLSVDFCGVVIGNKIPKDVLVEGVKDKVVEYVVENELTPCLSEREVKGD